MSGKKIAAIVLLVIQLLAIIGVAITNKFGSIFNNFATAIGFFIFAIIAIILFIVDAKNKNNN